MRRTIRSLLFLACLAGVAGTAQAQLGGLIKRAAGKAVEKKVEEQAPESDGGKPLGGDPLTPAVLDGVLKGLSLEIDKNAEAEKLRTVATAKNEEFQASRSAGSDEARAYTDRNNKITSCMYSSLQKSKDKNQELIAEKMMNLGRDPNAQAIAKKYGELSQSLMTAIQKKDSLAVNRFEAQVYHLFSIDVSKDSATAIKLCGKPSAPPASLVATQKLEAEKDALYEQLRTLEDGLANTAAQAAGLSVKDYALARERIWAWNAARQRRGTGGVTKDEDALFKSRAADIQKVQKVLR